MMVTEMDTQCARRAQVLRSRAVGGGLGVGKFKQQRTCRQFFQEGCLTQKVTGKG